MGSVFPALRAAGQQGGVKGEFVKRHGDRRYRLNEDVEAKSSQTHPI
jgi:hypothetical protein